MDDEKKVGYYSEENSSTVLLDDSKLRRKLLDDFVNTTDEKMKVYLRIRPLGTSRVTSHEDQNCLHIQDDNTVIMRAPKESIVFKSSSHDASKLQQKFVFTHVFGSEVGQNEFFNLTMNTTMKEFIDGQNWLIFAYGITNSGKTYTIKGTKAQPGIIPRSINVLFSNLEGDVLQTPLYKPHSFSDVVCLTEKDQLRELAIKESLIHHYGNKEERDESSSFNSLIKCNLTQSCTISDDTLGTTYIFKDQEETSSMQVKIHHNTCTIDESKHAACAIWISFLEVYNEQIFDLLVPLTTQKRNPLHLAQDKNGNTHVKGLCEVFVSSAEETYQLLKLGQKNLRIASTKLNHQSSRSHSIFNIKIVRVFNIENIQTARVNSLSFCDLAGSERCTKTKNSGERLKEAGNINTSLMVLGRCIDALRHNQNNKNRVVPFRDSKLTRIFQSFFTGKGQAAMIVNVNMCESMFDETINVMKFSAIANQVITTDYETSLLSVSSKIVARLTELWTRSSRDWSSISKARNQTDSILTVDESLVVQHETEEKTEHYKEIYEELVNLVKQLEKELIEAKQRNATMETEIRAEVCQEYSELMAEMEEVYRETALKAEESAEEYMENRIKLLEKAMSNSGHKNQCNESDSDNISSDEEPENLNDQIHEPKRVGKELEQNSPAMRKEDEELKKKLKETEEEVKNQESIIMKAGEILTEKETEIDTLKSIITKNQEKITLQEEEISNLQKQLKESHFQCEAANNLVQEKERESIQLKMELKAIEEQASTLRKDSEKQTSLELQAKIKELGKEKIEIQNEFVNLKSEFEMNKLVNINQISQMRLENSQNERLCAELKQKLCENSSEMAAMNKKCQECKKLLEEKMNKINDLEAKLFTYNSKSLETEEMQKEIQILQDKNNELNSELMVKNSKIVTLGSKLAIVNSECERMKAINKGTEALVVTKSNCNVTKLTERNHRGTSAVSSNDEDLQAIPITIDTGDQSFLEKHDMLEQTEDSALKCENSVFEESTRNEPSTLMSESIYNYSTGEQINASYSNSDDDISEQSEVDLKKENLTQQLENAIIELKAANEKNNMLSSEVESLRNEKERFSLLLSKAEGQLSSMLYSNEKNVMALVQEMFIKWKAINDLTLYLEKKLLFVTDEFILLTEKHKTETSNFDLELQEKIKEIEALKKSVHDTIGHSDSRVSEELENKIRELKDEFGKSENYTSIMKIENSKTIVELEKEVNEKEELLHSVEAILEEKSNEIHNLKKELSISIQERDTSKQAIDVLVNENEKLKLDKIDWLKEKETKINSLNALQKEVEKLQLEINKYIQEKSVENENISIITRKLDVLEAEKKNLIEEKDFLNKEQDNFKKEIQKLQEERLGSVKMADAANEELSNCKKEIRILEKENHNLQAQNLISNKEVDDYRKKIEELKQENSPFKTKINTLTLELDRYKTDLRILEEERTDFLEKIKISNKELETYKNKIEKLEKEHLSSVTEINITSEEMSCCKKEIDMFKEENVTLKENISALNNELVACRKKVTMLEENSVILEKTSISNKEMEKVRKEIVKLEDEKADLSASIAVANKELEDYMKKVQNLEKENQNSFEKIATINKELSDLKDLLSNRENERAISIKESDALRNELNSKLSETNELKKQNKIIMDQHSALSKDLEEKNSELANLKFQFVLIDEKRQSVENIMLSCVNEKEELEKRLKASNKDAKILSDTLTTRLKEVGEEVKTWKNEYNRLIIAVEEKENANSKLKTELEESELKLQQLGEMLAEKKLEQCLEKELKFLCFKFDKEYVELLQEQIQKKDAKLAMCTCTNEQENVEELERNQQPLIQDVQDSNVKGENVTPLQPEKVRAPRGRQTRGRGKKRTSVESIDCENDSNDIENAAGDVITNKRRTTKGGKIQKQASSADTEDAHRCIQQEYDGRNVSEETFRVPAKRQTRQRQALNSNKEKICPSNREDEKMSPLRRMGDYLKEKSPVLGAVTQLIMNTVTGNDKSDDLPVKPQERRRRKPLFSTDNVEAQIFSASSPKEEKSPHTIVTRQLRSRRRK